MVYTQIGTTSTTNYVRDAATYQWNLDSAIVVLAEPDKPLQYDVVETGITQCVRGFTIEDFATIEWFCDSSTDYQNLKKAKGFWKKNASSLTLHIECEAWAAVNLTQYADYATPTTLTDWTGFLHNFRYERHASGVLVRCRFSLATSMISTL